MRGSLSIELTCENDDCGHEYSVSVSPSDLQQRLEEQDINCPHCGEQLSGSGTLECYVCTNTQDFHDLTEAGYAIEEKCPACAGHPQWEGDVNFYTMRVAGSWYSEMRSYEWALEQKLTDELEREGRTDYWEAVIHFCKAEEFVAIYRDRTIRAASTGLYKKRNPDDSKAVCLTEATVPNWDELKATHGHYGYVFQKRELIAISGAPAIYLPESVIAQMKQTGERIPKTLWPYLNKLSLKPGQKFDYLHEREWRVPRDIKLDDVKPFGVVFPHVRPGVEDETLIIQAAREFGEVGYKF
ncbi:hypothetical protein Pan44_35300 [Caulifigura coniformis]|uniref:Uncharacterized protein n=1 Tax=Caulifigura coniformis TaxID=2527983 RepID=A0A517SH86_9PLAN|nr:hypothetical protein [Caulifigura coniformis]QDT55486.1 hypothetical protein Pan44_35300 [Caulifigura coniformis]